LWGKIPHLIASVDFVHHLYATTVCLSTRLGGILFTDLPIQKLYMQNKLPLTINSTGKEALDTTPKPIGTSALEYDMLVFCHLRWDFVYQRPQHLIEYMSKHYRVLFIEEPVPTPDPNGEPGMLTKINDNLTVLRPYADSIAEISSVLETYVANKEVAIGWFYSAAFVPFVNLFKFEKIVYDCMDELTLFKGANPELAAQETYLMSEADIVFTGGKKLYESKQHQHHNVHCFPSSVDRVHFEKALNGIEIPAEIDLPNPVVGYYGVIDERIDLELLEKVAERLPEISFVMVGPLAKIEDKDLPKSKNIHYTGIKSYNVLPAYLKGFDIAMMPFAINDATKYISPTKTLEYMAAHKPIISTPVHDVVRDYKDCIYIASTADEFCAAITNALEATNAQKIKQNKDYAAVLNATSWKMTADKMYEVIQKTEKA
jgi:glycosyltransferase involved in cell wall biosynthesis